ncbi:MAG: pyridoxal phosphate-dependent aminotransferase, partial [Acidobacteria bacterium]|nr:pyridoxal phosphate-dependent aminotransferase [Acidobacteriota bacterium]
MFSQRAPGELVANRLSIAAAALRAERVPIVDLTESNPTRAGFAYTPALLAPLADARGLKYEPSARGLPDARRAVAADYARRGIAVDADRIVLTASTSDAYGLLFKLLADAGDEVLVPRPSYPLFDHLARFDALVARPYDLDYQSAWTIDFSSVEAALSSRTRAVVLVSPNNPTGSFVKQDELGRMAALCAPHGIALIADEVFADYELEPGAAASAGRVLERDDVLAFALGGLSKSIGLPQLKLGWLAVAGPSALVADALERLELVCDTYLSVSTPVQAAARELLAMGAAVRAQIATRVTANFRHLVQRSAAAAACGVL